MSQRGGFSWTVVVLTCQHKDSEHAFQRELELRQQRGVLPPAALLLTVRDRQEPVGSGGATLNALLVAAEHLSSRAGHTGRDFPWSSCSRAFCWLPHQKPDQKVQAPVCCLDLLLDCLSEQVGRICPGSPPGVWVCSTDMILSVPPDFAMSWRGFSGVRVVSLPGDVSFAAHHGVYLCDSQGVVRDIVYRGTEDQIQQAVMPDGKVPLVSGPVFFSRSVSEKLLQTHVSPPLDGCTYQGLDSGAPPLQVDTLSCSTAGPQGAAVRSGRSELWRILRGAQLSLGQSDSNTHPAIQSLVSEGARIINSVLEGDVTVATGAVVQHCHLQVRMSSGLFRRFHHLQTFLLGLHRYHFLDGDGLFDGVSFMTDVRLVPPPPQVSSDDSTASFLNQRWSDFFSRTGIQCEDLWVRGEPHSLLEARLFPVLHPRGGIVGLEGGVAWLLGGGGRLQEWREAWRLSLREVLSLSHQEAELQWREELLLLAGRRGVTDALRSRSDACLLPCFRAAVLGGQQDALQQGAESGAELGVAARCLSCIADVLVCMAGGRGGLRSGPAANRAWSSAYALLEEGDLRGGVGALAAQRRSWLSRPNLLVRAARHYEGAGQVLLRQAVMSSQRFISIGRGEVPPLGEWQEVQCPARLDLAGGWSDTPPIAFEHGGSVTNVAVKVDGKRPIGARARRIAEPRLLLVSHSGGRGSGVSTETVCERLDDLKDYCQPHAPGALLKAVCVCSGLVSLSSQHALGDQLMQQWGGGVEIHSWSELPTGSGLGTSSILAGALLAAVYRCTGQSYTTDSLIHAVLYLEQILTTGGGWQDQVGGVVGGLKVGRSSAALPLKVEVERLRPPEDFLASLEQHLLLVYTGKTRLARNLLQDVVRSWYSRLPSMVTNAQQLVWNSEECARACSHGCLTSLGACLDRSWQQKKRMAPGCEPASVRAMMDALRPLVLGQSLAGAGGGGFLYLLTREPRQREAVLRVLHGTPGLGDVSVHSVQLDMDGLTELPPYCDPHTPGSV
uniref:L-fucose kinase n=1 Tax=Salarias fasciatus TaxID=181472 RepID=A0A672HF50_SALFA